jgi:hypothetical protein
MKAIPVDFLQDSTRKYVYERYALQFEYLKGRRCG